MKTIDEVLVGTRYEYADTGMVEYVPSVGQKQYEEDSTQYLVRDAKRNAAIATLLLPIVEGFKDTIDNTESYGAIHKDSNFSRYVLDALATIKSWEA